MRLPFGSDTEACSPGARPSSATATGDSADRRPSPRRGVVRADDPPGLLAAILVAHDDGRAEADDAAGAGGRLLDDHRVGDLLAQPRDLRLEVRLIVLGVVVLAVLLQIAPFARGLDALGDLPASLPLERRQLGAERLQALGRRQVRRLAHCQEPTPPAVCAACAG